MAEWAATGGPPRPGPVAPHEPTARSPLAHRRRAATGPVAPPAHDAIPAAERTDDDDHLTEITAIMDYFRREGA